LYCGSILTIISVDNGNIGFILLSIILFPFIDWIAGFESKTMNISFLLFYLFFGLILCFLLISLLLFFMLSLIIWSLTSIYPDPFCIMEDLIVIYSWIIILSIFSFSLFFSLILTLKLILSLNALFSYLFMFLLFLSFYYLAIFLDGLWARVNVSIHG